jgi:phosphatidate cytidylyltransferase
VSSAWFGPLALGLLFLFFASVGLYEIYDLLRHKESNAPRWFKGMSIGVLIYLLIFLIATDSISAGYLWILALLIPIIFCAELIRLDQLALSNLALTIFGWVYVIVPFSLINLLAQVHGIYEFEIPVGYFLVLWANDTGAYFTGKWLGKTKLYQKVSPNKTWEGLFGGMFLSFAAAFLFWKISESLQLRDWLVMAFIVSVFGNLGDLFESHLKRNFGVKDSGNIIPGHGGVLDRFDGLLISLPVLIAYFKLIQLI